MIKCGPAIVTASGNIKDPAHELFWLNDNWEFGVCPRDKINFYTEINLGAYFIPSNAACPKEFSGNVLLASV